MIDWPKIFKRADRLESHKDIKSSHAEYLYDLQGIIEQELKFKLEPVVKALESYAYGFSGEDGDEAREALVYMGYRDRK